MFIKGILKRIDLSFWQGAVRTLNLSKLISHKMSRKIYDLLPEGKGMHIREIRLSFQNVVLGILLVGFLSGIMFVNISSAFSTNQEKVPMQSNTLLALVDDASSENSQLLGLWLLVIPEADQSMHWMPIYPVPLDEMTSSKYALEHKPILVDHSDEISWETIAPLRASGVFWEHYILIDKSAMKTIFGENPDLAMTSMAESWESPQKALQEQVSLIHSFCNSSADDLNIDAWLSLFDMGIHGKSNLSKFNMISLWDHFFVQGSGIDCQHAWIN